MPTEHQEQAELFRWASMTLLPGKAGSKISSLMFAIPNEGKRSMAVAMRMKAAGMRAGVPDIFLAAPMFPCAGLFIEMKKTCGGSVKKAQKEWLQKLKEAGYRAEVCRGAEEAKRVICDHLRIAYEQDKAA